MDEATYVKLLDKAYRDMPEQYYIAQRFEVPKVRGHIEGNKTVISNFLQIANTLRRDPEHLLKFLLKELGTRGALKHSTLIFATRLSSQFINEKIKAYAKKFVICPVCGKPDTELVREHDVLYMKCHACGAKTYIKTRVK